VTSIIGKRILVADDEALIAMMVADMLKELGAIVVGPVYSYKQVLQAIAAGGFDGVILDVNLGDSLSFEAAKRLQRKGSPFCFATGYGAVIIPAEFSKTLVLQKPYGIAALAKCLDDLFGGDQIAHAPDAACVGL
jgi:CheY-like chemotaxis protein